MYSTTALQFRLLPPPILTPLDEHPLLEATIVPSFARLATASFLGFRLRRLCRELRALAYSPRSHLIELGALLHTLLESCEELVLLNMSSMPTEPTLQVIPWLDQCPFRTHLTKLELQLKCDPLYCCDPCASCMTCTPLHCLSMALQDNTGRHMGPGTTVIQ